MDHAERYAREVGCQYLELSTTPFLSSALRLYKRLGFRQQSGGEDELFGTPLVAMRKRLG